jgi:hypothetical protein
VGASAAETGSQDPGARRDGELAGGPEVHGGAGPVGCRLLHQLLAEGRAQVLGRDVDPRVARVVDGFEVHEDLLVPVHELDAPVCGVGLVPLVAEVLLVVGRVEHLPSAVGPLDVVGQVVDHIEEFVLACDLVARNQWHELPSERREVEELSALLQSLPIHADELRGPKFRSPSSVRRKMADIATRHPDSPRKPTNGGKLDVEVLRAFLKRPNEMHAIADRLRSAAVAGEFDTLPATDEVVGDGEGALEGRLLERIHLRRERNPRLRAKKIKKALQERGTLACEVCGFDFQRAYGSRGEGYAECHHVVPLHTTGETTTQLKDLAVLCANCHRMIHRGTDWLTPSELRDIVQARRAVTS